MAKRSQLPLTALRAFEAFARLGKMSLAADELCVTHGAVSRQVRSLEALCGVKLTQGPRNALKLTDPGERMARSLGRTFDELEQSFLEVRAAADRELHISCVGTLAMKWLIPRLSNFHTRHPDLSIRVTEAYGPVDFTREPFDAAIGMLDAPLDHGLFVAGHAQLPVLMVHRIDRAVGPFEQHRAPREPEREAARCHAAARAFDVGRRTADILADAP